MAHFRAPPHFWCSSDLGFIVSNLPDLMLDWKSGFFYARFKETKGVGHYVRGARDKVEDDPRVFQLNNLKWCLLKGVFFWWCQGLSFFDTPAVFTQGEAEERQLASDEERLRKKKRLVKGTGLTLSHEEAHRSGLVVASPKAAVEPTNEGALILAPSSEKEPFGTPTWMTLESAEARVVADQGLGVEDAEDPGRPSPSVIEESQGKPCFGLKSSYG
ncbi:hypothetical protein ACLOJK_038652 [Asimina triloba]